MVGGAWMGAHMRKVAVQAALRRQRDRPGCARGRRAHGAPQPAGSERFRLRVPTGVHVGAGAGGAALAVVEEAGKVGLLHCLVHVHRLVNLSQ